MSNENRQLAVMESPGALQAFLQRAESAIQMALPPHLDAKRMIRLAVTAYSMTPAIRKCTGQSILASVMAAAQMGLEPGVRGQAYLIPYGNNCTLVAGWQGLVQLLNNSGRATAWTGAVYEGDEWDFQLGSSPRCQHRPGPNHGDEKKLIAVYACGKVNGSEQPVVEAWTMARVWRHRDQYNKVGNRHYSHAHPEMYARKVVLLQVLKYMPASVQLANATAMAVNAERGVASTIEGGVVVEVEQAPMSEGAVGRSAIEEQSQPPQDEKQPPPGAGAAPTADELRAEIKGKLAKLSKSTKELGVVLMKMEIIRDAKLFSDLSFEELLATVQSWEQIEEALK